MFIVASVDHEADGVSVEVRESVLCISRSRTRYVNGNIPGNHDIKELQQTAILGTAHILREVLM